MIRRRFVIRGVVQGVGFRPHLARIAHELQLSGLCGNDDSSVFVEVQGTPHVVESYISVVFDRLPPQARVDSSEETEINVRETESGFVIVESQRTSNSLTLIPPDISPCSDCLAELNNPLDRRYRYPLISCMNCGPRLSVVKELPYDRANTTLADFPMCPQCSQEYADPLNRRFHAEPISCFECGPRVWLEEAGLVTGEWEDALTRTRELIAAGGIVAVKGIGGFALMCDATNQDAIERLRVRKNRPKKPFAVMASEIETVRNVVSLNPGQERELLSQQRPIVLAQRNAEAPLAPGIAPGLGDVGVMLPSSPIHELLLQPGDVWVCTSGNISGDPICYRNEDAERALSRIADAFLFHNRDIYIPVEDSVIMANNEGTLPVRRSRGYAPLPFAAEIDQRTVLAVGGELKNTFTITRDGMAFVSPHIGDMGSLATQLAYERAVEQMLSAHRTKPDLIVADAHPNYSTSAWAERYSLKYDIPLLRVQHHHAHALSLLMEHGLAEEPAYVVVFDGTGFGLDETIWGGEILHVKGLECERIWHLPSFGLPGGDSAITNPWKSAISLLKTLNIPYENLPPFLSASQEEVTLVNSQLENSVAVVQTTSAGRLFDAVSSLLGICQYATYEAEAAMELEAQARLCECLTHDFPGAETAEQLIHNLVGLLQQNEAISCLARYFHEGLAHVVAGVITATVPDREIVGFSGGVFQNRLFGNELTSLLQESAMSYRIVTHARVPPNDGGLSLGQASAGLLHLRQGGEAQCA